MVVYIFIFSVIEFVREYLSKKRGSGSGCVSVFVYFIYTTKERYVYLRSGGVSLILIE